MKAVLFDLDYTLYDADLYYLEAFQDIAEYLESKYKLQKNEVYQTIVKMSKQRKDFSNLFNDLLEYYNLNENIANIVEIFNKHEINSFHLYQDALPTLKMLRSKNYKLGIITDGNIARQTRKILKFDLDKLVDNVTYTKNSEAKPSPIPFVTALKAIDVEASSAIYVGDNPLVDFKGPKITGMKTARIVRGRFTHIPSDSQVDYTIEKMDEILKILSDL